MSKIFVFESICGDVFHSQFNAAFLSKLRGNVIFFSNEKHWSSVAGKVRIKMTWENEPIREKKVINNLLWAFKIKGKLDKDCEIIFLSSDIFIYYRCILLRILGFKNISYVSHADLQNVSAKKRIKDYFLFFRRHYFLMKILDFLKVNVILLSKSISYNLSYYINLKNKSVIEHPYIYDESFHSKDYSPDNIKIGFIGLPTEEKGYLWLYDQIKKVDRRESISFYLIGSKKTVEYTSDEFVFCFDNDNSISDIDIKNELTKVDYVIFPFKSDDYKLRASGTLFDAINARKPILTTENSFVKEIINCDNPMGIVFDQELGLNELYKKIGEISQKEYNEYVCNIDTFVSKRLPDV